ncbi:MAG: pyridoxamine 5'-phosphate oxidase family protein [Chloroflexi bacterium]|nr:pyridoxamine 5'-phosphate oxidase family protein [Chloroflexota bacterium]
MAKLTPEMKNFLNKERDPAQIFVGTATRDGIPNISIKGTFVVIPDDETILFADVYSSKTLENVKRNPNVTIAAMNSKTFKGYQFKGKAEVVESGPVLEDARKLNPGLKSVTRVKVQEIYLMDYGPQAGKKIA